MLTLPSSGYQVPPSQAAVHEPVTYIEPVARSKRAKIPLITIAVAITLVLIIGFYVLVR